MNINTSLIINTESTFSKGIQFSDATFLETVFEEHMKESSELFTDGPTIQLELGSLSTGLKINSISTTYSFAPGISFSDTISKLQNSTIIDNLYTPENNDSQSTDKVSNNNTVQDKPSQQSNIDITPSKVDYANKKGDIFDTSKAKPTKEEIFKLVEDIAPKYNVDSSLVKAIIQTESTFNNQCISHAGAVGLMQLKPEAAREMGLTVNNTVDERWDPRKNIEAGVKYLAKYHKIISKHFGKEDWNLTLASYNAGPTRVMNVGGVPNNKETVNYIKKVNKAWNEYK